MVTQKLNFWGVALITILLIIINVDKATSLKCYICKSDENGDCWSSPSEKYLKECTSENTTTSSSSSDTIISTITSSQTTPPSTTIPPSSSPSTTTSATLLSRTASSLNSILKQVQDIEVQEYTNQYKCIKLIYNDDDITMVERKCISETMKVPCENEKAEHSGLRTCITCQDRDKCNSSSNITIGLISTLIPLGIIFHVLKT